MKKNIKAGAILILVPAFFIYFCSESILRQAIVSGIAPDSVNIDAVLAEMPGYIRDSIDHKVQVGQIKDSIAKASTDSERAYSKCSLAGIMKDESEKENLLKQVIKEYPSEKGTVRAYLFFLLNPETRKKLSIKEYQDYIKKFPQIDQYYMWSMGLAKLNQKKASDQKSLEFLMPLMTIKPEYKDYSSLYDKIALLAGKMKKTDLYAKARKKETKSLEYRSIETVINEQMLNDLNTKGQK